MEYVVLAQGRERRWKRSQDVSSVWGGNLVLRNYPPIGIWVDKGPKSEKIAENCTFFFGDHRFCYVWLSKVEDWMFFFSLA